MLFSDLFKFVRYYCSFIKGQVPRREYFDVFIHETSLLDLHNLVHHFPQDRVLTDAKLRFQNLIPGTSTFKVRLSLGRPDSTQSFLYNNIQHTVDSYKLGGGWSSIINCHFLNNRLFYVHTCIRFPNASAIRKIIHLLEKKFGISLEHFKSGFVLHNRTDEILLCKPGLDIDLYNISMDNSFLKLIENAIGEKEKAVAAREAEELDVLEIMLS